MQNLRLILRFIFILALFVSVVWFVYRPGFDSIISVLSAITAIIGSFIDRHNNSLISKKSSVIPSQKAAPLPYKKAVSKSQICLQDVLQVSNSSIDKIAISPNGQLLASCEWSSVTIWDMASRQKLWTKHNWISSISFSPDSQILATGHSGSWDVQLWPDRSVHLRNVENGHTIQRLKGHTEAVYSVVFHPDGHTLASGGHDKTIRLWDIVTGRELLRLEGHTSTVNRLAFSPDGRTLASSGNDETVRLWDVVTERELQRANRKSNAVFSPSGHILAMKDTSRKVIVLWDVVKWQELRQLQNATTMAFSPDGQVLALGTTDNLILLKNVYDGTELSRLEGYGKVISSVSFNHDGSFLVSGGDNGTVCLWQIQ